MTFRGDYAQGQGGNVNTSSGGGRGGGGLGSGAMMLLPLLLRGGGGGTIILVLLALLYFSGAFDGLLGGGNDSQQQSQDEYSLEHCQEQGSSNEYDDCRAAATMGSLNSIWAEVLPAQADVQFTEPEMTLFKNNVNTGCGFASSDTGPFYCPRDKTAYLDVSFFNQLSQLGGSNGPLAQEYVTAHEFGHHIQNLEGTLGLSDYKNPGEDSAAVAIELQADCYAGIWAHKASQGENAALEPISDEQLHQVMQTAQSIGDDSIQRHSGGEVDPDSWTHGSSEQRMQAFKSGYESGKMSACDTLNRGVYKS
ncbi:KPN_02809 family neutral zinc metallopeptidase [Corynebacterium fournieri]|uniref:KPN_02809 family neutral zinc metallopeptidase n=1 Tax=Corynebacterium fournieri TaxID=1852390 RepID=UPI000A2F5110|nr:neutral zinc metallopeptidase [Corynebacterium fournieri]WJY97683.1 Putative neutral zinc metallopeptidase [Corynebacterium fournieri]